jgi:hypothetical protein
MSYPIRQPPPRPEPRQPRKYPEIVELEVGQGFFVPFADLRHSADPAHCMRTMAWTWSRALQRKFATRRAPKGVWLVREA